MTITVQVYVRVADLTLDPVPIIAYYPDMPVLAFDLHGIGTTQLILPIDAVIPGTPFNPSSDTPPTLPELTSNFRASHMPVMVNGEAARRINAVFPDYMQRNSSADINNSTMKYGADSSTWPQDAKDRKAQNDQGWSFVSSVRQVADALETQTTLTNPTDDAHWPVSPPPIYIPPVP